MQYNREIISFIRTFKNEKNMQKRRLSHHETGDEETEGEEEKKGRLEEREREEGK